ncbi:hypothetical protein ACP4OV_004680 [Aristida adscensionis]
MGWPSTRRGRRRGLTAALLLLLHLLLLASILGLGTCSRAAAAARRGVVAPEEYSWSWEPAAVAARRGLVGPGSSPPTCRSRCGGCHPCRPVHVAIQPGRSFLLEYYPEAWRCKCGNKLFMP